MHTTASGAFSRLHRIEPNIFDYGYHQRALTLYIIWLCNSCSSSIRFSAVFLHCVRPPIASIREGFPQHAKRILPPKRENRRITDSRLGSPRYRQTNLCNSGAPNRLRATRPGLGPQVGHIRQSPDGALSRADPHEAVDQPIY